MYIEQIYTPCLSQAAYYISSGGEAAVIDPLRDSGQFIEKARAEGAEIRYVFETHFHADFVSGHLDLAAATGAEIVFGPTASPSFKALVAVDHQKFRIGNIELELLHTPGHTPESYCLLLRDESKTEKVLFTGDTLFLGDVGRPDLAQQAANMNSEELAGILFDSINEKILPLPDQLVLYPGHGAGSACGKHLSRETSDTLGHQKLTNYALREGIRREEFIQEVLTDLAPPPKYFPLDATLNKTGYRSLNDILYKGNTALSKELFLAASHDLRTLFIDTRPPDVFMKGFIPGSIFLDLAGDFASWAGILLGDINTPVAFVAEPGTEKEVVTRLARIGYDNSIGYLDCEMRDWLDAGYPVDHIESMNTDTLTDTLQESPVAYLLDVRSKAEFDSECVTGAVNIPLQEIQEKAHLLDTHTKYYVYCGAGIRSVMFISYMKRLGNYDLTNIEGGINAMKANGRLNISSPLQIPELN